MDIVIWDVVNMIEKQRTGQQNRGLYLFFSQLAESLNNAGYSQRDVFEKAKAFDAPCTKDFIHGIWIYFQKSMYGTNSTTELLKQEQIDEIHKVIMKNMGEILHIEHIPFPNNPDKEKAIMQDETPAWHK